MELKDRIKELRLRRGLSQTALAAELDKFKDDPNDKTSTYIQTISGWEKGRDPNLTSLIRLAKVFNVSTDYLLGLAEEDSYTDLMYDLEGVDSLSEVKEKIKDYPIYVKNSILRRLSSYYSIINTYSPEWEEGGLIQFYYLSEITFRYQTILANKFYWSGDRDKDDEFLANGWIIRQRYEMESIVELSHLLGEFIEVINKKKSIYDIMKADDDRIGENQKKFNNSDVKE